MDGSTTESEKMPVVQLSSMLKLKVIPEIRGSKAILIYIYIYYIHIYLSLSLYLSFTTQCIDGGSCWFLNPFVTQWLLSYSVIMWKVPGRIPRIFQGWITREFSLASPNFCCIPLLNGKW